MKKEKKRFPKNKIVRFDRYKHRVDLLHVLLESDKMYTIDEVNQTIDKFMNGGRKKWL